ncbi:MAG: PIG-L family deacetylase [Bacteroidetes bacterium]|nr:PIG-L family deacetylase [Bacteroidota bacterium]
MLKVLTLIICFGWAFQLNAQTAIKPKVLLVTAHPDDETGCAATVYRITHELNGEVELCVITNGEAGYKYSTLAEPIYQLKLTEEAIGRKHLPAIRKRELIKAAKIIGINKIYFLLEKDSHYGLDERDPLDTSWNSTRVEKKLHEIMVKGKYDFVFCMIPDSSTHAGHKAATLLILRTIQKLNIPKPIVLAYDVTDSLSTDKNNFLQLKDYTETRFDRTVAPFEVSRLKKFGFKNRLDYRIIVNWEIAEHKSQGVMQTAMNRGDIERFYYFALNSEQGKLKAQELFDALK